MAGKLYIVPTPVGNLDDMTPRAIAVLRDAHLVLAEDTRTSGVLMKHFGITTPMLATTNSMSTTRSLLWWKSCKVAASLRW